MVQAKNNGPEFDIAADVIGLFLDLRKVESIFFRPLSCSREKAKKKQARKETLHFSNDSTFGMKVRVNTSSGKSRFTIFANIMTDL
jgi:hypothetical protein